MAKKVAGHLGKDLGARLLCREPLELGDEDSGRLLEQFKSWSARVIRNIKLAPVAHEIYEEEEEQEEEVEEEEEEEEGEEGADEVDMEDLGGAAPKRNELKSKPSDTEVSSGPPSMLTPLVRSSLTKQGYKLIGSHSGVKMCRWTKSMMRGRGGCYKHAFYGIESHRCMEHTPSLACANKCVFCWRHHSNPVGKTWKWQMDDPISIVTEAVKLHQGMIKEYSGVPGVWPERVKEGLDIRHCALSLVGEPIMSVRFPSCFSSLPPLIFGY